LECSTRKSLCDRRWPNKRREHPLLLVLAGISFSLA
jgi:hypothetical protein